MVTYSNWTVCVICASHGNALIGVLLNGQKEVMGTANMTEMMKRDKRHLSANLLWYSLWYYVSVLSKSNQSSCGKQVSRNGSLVRCVMINTGQIEGCLRNWLPESLKDPRNGAIWPRNPRHVRNK